MITDGNFSMKRWKLLDDYVEIIICTYGKLLEDKPKTTRSICGNYKSTWRNYNIREAESYLMIIWKLLDEKVETTLYAFNYISKFYINWTFSNFCSPHKQKTFTNFSFQSFIVRTGAELLNL